MAKTLKTQLELEAKAASALLGEGELIYIKGIGKSYTMRQASMRTMVKISKEASKIEIPEDVNVFSVLASSVANADSVARIIAIAIIQDSVQEEIVSKSYLFGLINKQKKITISPERQIKELADKLMYIPVNEIKELVTAMIEKSSTDFFFSSINLLSQIRIMAPMKETIASGAQ